MKEKIDGVDYAVLVLILLLSMIIGLLNTFKNGLKKLLKKFKLSSNKVNDEIEFQEKNNKKDDQVNEYLIAKSSVGLIPIAFSLFATYYSATTLLGVPAEIYQYGIQYWIGVFGMIIPPLFGAFITGPFLAKFDLVSIFEYIEMRYNSKKVRLISTICYVVRSFISSAIYMYGPSTAFSYMTKLDERISIALIGLIGTCYTTIGGLRAVIWTDLFQGIVMFSSLFFIIIKGVYDLNGFSNLWNINLDGGRLDLFDFNPDPFIRQSFWSLFFGMIVSSLISYGFDQQMIQRFKAANSKKTAQIALVLNIPFIFIMISLCCFIGLILYATNYDCDPLLSSIIKSPNQLVAYFVLKNLGSFSGVGGLFLGSLFCASLSSVSSSLNSQAAIIWEDFFKYFKYFRLYDDKKSLKTNKIIVLVCGFLSIGFSFLIATLKGNLIQISTSLNGALISPLIGLFLLSFFFSIANSIGAISGMIIGFSGSMFVSVGSFIVKPNYPKLNVTIESCGFNSTNYFNSSIVSENVDGFDKFFYLSYMWYSTFGSLLTLIFGIIISVLTGGLKNTNKYKPFLLYDLCSLCIKKK